MQEVWLFFTFYVEEQMCGIALIIANKHRWAGSFDKGNPNNDSELMPPYRK